MHYFIFLQITFVSIFVIIYFKIIIIYNKEIDEISIER